MTVGDLIKELERFAPSLPVRIFKDDTIYDFYIDVLTDRIDFNVLED